jgi:hypothetical protein
MRMLGPTQEKETRDWWKLHDKFHNLLLPSTQQLVCKDELLIDIHGNMFQH